jgi:thymidylate kinase
VGAITLATGDAISADGPQSAKQSSPQHAHLILVVVEGLDGTGKSTTVRSVAHALVASGVDARSAKADSWAKADWQRVPPPDRDLRFNLQLRSLQSLARDLCAGPLQSAEVVICD